MRKFPSFLPLTPDFNIQFYLLFNHILIIIIKQKLLAGWISQRCCDMQSSVETLVFALISASEWRVGFDSWWALS